MPSAQYRDTQPPPGNETDRKTDSRGRAGLDKQTDNGWETILSRSNVKNSNNEMNAYCKTKVERTNTKLALRLLKEIKLDDD